MIYILIWNRYFFPIKMSNENDYLKLYIQIQERLNQITFTNNEIDEIRRLLCLLESLKYKNKEMTEVLTLQWVKLKYGMTHSEMAEVIGN